MNDEGTSGYLFQYNKVIEIPVQDSWYGQVDKFLHINAYGPGCQCQ